MPVKEYFHRHSKIEAIEYREGDLTAIIHFLISKKVAFHYDFPFGLTFPWCKSQPLPGDMLVYTKGVLKVMTPGAFQEKYCG